ncbi:uncharacterized protein LOC101862117 [Aplysia californica]|uniref:Uncharacterized protein LOC101862117 n=1 Tax=Aplysia californica TaxID=6500 RepID=A0ABM0JSA8_APLCA|nr:uncharacterized protein LOC101862117 [Aplysia californica]
MNKKSKGLAEIISAYNSKTFKPENFQEIPRLFGPSAAIDMNRLVCQHQQHVASAYMRRIRKDKMKQQDVYFRKLQNIPLTIRRMAVGPDYQDPYTSFKMRLPKLGVDNRIERPYSPRVNATDGKNYVSHNSLSPHINVLFKMNPAGAPLKGSTNTNNKFGKSPINPEGDLSFPNSPRKSKPKYLQSDLFPIRKRLSVDINAAQSQTSPRHSDVSVDNSPRCPTNSPRNHKAFWSFKVPNELNKGGKKGQHVPSIPRCRDALAAISSVQKHNKPLPAIVVKV